MLCPQCITKKLSYLFNLKSYYALTRNCLNLGVEEDFWNHNFSGESGEIIRRIKKESSKDLENKKFCNDSMYICMYVCKFLVVLVQQEGKKKREEQQ